MRRWILLLAGVFALLVMAGGAVPTGSEAVPDCSKPNAPEKHCPAGGSGSSSGSLVLVETSTKTKGATTVTWDSGFQDLDYTVGDTINMTVTWTVDAGAADFVGIAFKDKNWCTPKDGETEPAECSAMSFSYSPGANSVDVSFAFTALHMDWKRVPPTEIGTAHFKLSLLVDADGDGVPETQVGYGVNVHVEDPQ